MYFVYMIKNNLNKLYIGVSKDPLKRVFHHNSRRGSVFTKTGKFKIVFLEKYKFLSEARAREIQIKKWSRIKKDFLIEKYQKGFSTKY
ncbi:GIY-YIG nuclease family protein [Candidatus Pacebacteria bacterium]|nr:GIY-YIG nuclease family protein [Candidatus Paceibacterota bacterium]